MKYIFIFLILISLVLNTDKKELSELDLIDTYSLKINNNKLYGTINSHLNLFGLPEKVIQNNTNIEFKTNKDVLSIINNTVDYSIVGFKGIEFWSFSDFESIPTKIDFRKFNKTISYKSLQFSNDYTLNQFEKDFFNSFKNSPKTPISFFQMSTNENKDNLSHFIVERGTKSDPKKKLLIEFTFEKQ